MPKFLDERRTDAAEREQRVLARFAEPQGGKECEAGLETRVGALENLRNLGSLVNAILPNLIKFPKLFMRTRKKQRPRT